MSSSPSPVASDDATGVPDNNPATISVGGPTTKRKKHHHHQQEQQQRKKSPSAEEEEDNDPIESGEAGNNSDNSSGGIMSIGNNSFGFNFDNDEGLGAGGRNSNGSGGNNSNNEDDNNSDGRKSDSTHFSCTFQAKLSSTASSSNPTSRTTMMTSDSRTTTGLSSLTNSSSSPSRSYNDQQSSNSNDNVDEDEDGIQHNIDNYTNTATIDAPATATTMTAGGAAAESGSSGELLSFGSELPNNNDNNEDGRKKRKSPEEDAQESTHQILMAAMAESSSSRNMIQMIQNNNNNNTMASDLYDCGIDDSGGYSDNESVTTSQQDGGGGDDYSKGGGHRRKKKLDNNKREERNQREKERSFRISKQITELRELLSNGGVVVPKGTKSSVLTEAANYIRMLQQHQYRSEIDRHQLIQQMQLIGQGAHGPQAAQAIRHFAAQNGVWSLGNFGGVPPTSAMNFTTTAAADGCLSSSTAAATTVPDAEVSAAGPTDSNAFQQNKVEPSEYRFIFNSCGVGMAIASMGGAFVDCNQLFCQLSSYSKQEVCSMTIFNMTARSDLQRAFDQISQLISPPIDEIVQSSEDGGDSGNNNSSTERQPVTFRGSLRHRDDLGLCVSLVKGEDGVSKCFCVSLVKNPTTPFENSQPIAASFESILPTTTNTTSVAVDNDNKTGPAASATPAFTSG